MTGIRSGGQRHVGGHGVLQNTEATPGPTQSPARETAPAQRQRPGHDPPPDLRASYSGPHGLRPRLGQGVELLAAQPIAVAHRRHVRDEVAVSGTETSLVSHEPAARPGQVPGTDAAPERQRGLADEASGEGPTLDAPTDKKVARGHSRATSGGLAGYILTAYAQRRPRLVGTAPSSVDSRVEWIRPRLRAG
jgi:hypothetical protein